jgi:tetratricopeptide (TPR) repeat protein
MKKIAALAFVLTVVGCDKTEAPNPTPKESTPPPSASASATPAPAAGKEIPATTSNKEALEAFRLGIDMSENARGDEAREQFKKARTLDPKFLSAIAMEGAMTPGPDGDKTIADTLAQASALPEAEQVYLKIAQAFHADDPSTASRHGKKLTELVPGAWHAHFIYGRALNGAGKRDEATAAFKKAIELEPKAGIAYNDLSYVELGQGKIDDAIAHLKKYAEIVPKEANAQDSLGEALLMGGKYDEAEAAYKKATELNPKFNEATSGLGFVRLYKGDWAGAFDALGKYRDAAPNVAEKGMAYRTIAWAQAAQGKTADALKTLDAWDADAAKAKNEESAFYATQQRAEILVVSGKSADAIKLLSPLADRIDKAQSPDVKKNRWRVYARFAEVMAYSALAKAPEAEKAGAAIAELVGTSDDAELKGAVAAAKGMVATAKGDAKAAAEAYKGCWVFDDYCTGERIKAEEKSGDKPAAASSRKALLAIHRRDPMSFYAWSKAGPATPAAAPATSR